jgi:hypothetical protein
MAITSKEKADYFAELPTETEEISGRFTSMFDDGDNRGFDLFEVFQKQSEVNRV